MLAAGAGLAAWISVVGGALVWARFASAHIAPGQSVALQSRSYLIAEGLRALLFPLLLAAAAAAVVYLTHGQAIPPPGTAQQQGVRPSLARLGIPVWISVLLSVVIGVAVVWEGAAGIRVKPWLELVAISAGTALVLLLGMGRARTPRSAAALLFIAVALWSGAFGYLTTEGQRHPKLNLALVRLTGEKETVAVGYLVARTGGDLYLAQAVPYRTGDAPPEQRHGFRVRRFSEQHIVTDSFGPTHRIGYNDSPAALLRVFQAVLTER